MTWHSVARLMESRSAANCTPFTSHTSGLAFLLFILNSSMSPQWTKWLLYKGGEAGNKDPIYNKHSQICKLKGNWKYGWNQLTDFQVRHAGFSVCYTLKSLIASVLKWYGGLLWNYSIQHAPKKQTHKQKTPPSIHWENIKPHKLPSFSIDIKVLLFSRRSDEVTVKYFGHLKTSLGSHNGLLLKQVLKRCSKSINFV